MQLIFKGTIPSKKNSRITNTKTGRSFPSKQYTEWEKGMVAYLNEIRPIHFRNPVQINYTFYQPLTKKGEIPKRQFDMSNKIESINDMLVKAYMISDDSIQYLNKITAQAFFTKDNDQYCVLEITEMPQIEVLETFRDNLSSEK